jgi:hypothetical protein
MLAAGGDAQRTTAQMRDALVGALGDRCSQQWLLRLALRCSERLRREEGDGAIATPEPADEFRVTPGIDGDQA